MNILFGAITDAVPSIVGVGVGYFASYFKSDKAEYFSPGYRFKYVKFSEYSLTKDELEIHSDNLEEYDKFAKTYISNASTVHDKCVEKGPGVSGNLININTMQLLPESAWENLLLVSKEKEKFRLAQSFYGDKDVNKAVILHELGHIHYRHTHKLRQYSIFAISALCIPFLLSIFDVLPKTGRVGGFSVLFAGLYMGQFYRRRQYEYEADSYAAKNGYGTHLITFLKRSGDKLNEDLSSNPLYYLRYMLDEHPSSVRRIDHIKKIMSSC